MKTTTCRRAGAAPCAASCCRPSGVSSAACVSSTARKFEMSFFCPFSKTSKSAFVRPFTGLPLRSVTTASTLMTRTSMTSPYCWASVGSASTTLRTAAAMRWLRIASLPLRLARARRDEHEVAAALVGAEAALRALVHGPLRALDELRGARRLGAELGADRGRANAGLHPDLRRQPRLEVLAVRLIEAHRLVHARRDVLAAAIRGALRGQLPHLRLDLAAVAAHPAVADEGEDDDGEDADGDDAEEDLQPAGHARYFAACLLPARSSICPSWIRT